MSPSRTHQSRRGLSLLEVLIALAVFLGATAAIGQLVSLGSRAAIQTQIQTQAILNAESCLSEVVAGTVPLTNHSGQPCQNDPMWNWSLTVSAGPHADLVRVEVTVSRAVSTGTSADTFTLTRLMRDPQALFNTTAASTSTSPTGGGL